MSYLLAARIQMALSLAFHIIFAGVSIAMPAFMVAAEALWLRTKDRAYLDLARAWAKGTAIFFAVGAVSGTLLSFELGLLWPKFMGEVGGAIGFPFALEGFAFFTEAIFLGIYLYGWDRVGPRAHLAAGFVVALSGLLSACFVICANSWMNTPAGYELREGKLIATDPVAAMLNPAAFHEVVHAVLACFAATGFAVAGLASLQLLKEDGGLARPIRERALAIALAFGGGAALLMPVSGDLAARRVAELEPVKLAALEGHFKTAKGASLKIGGLPDVEARETRYAIEIPHGLSLLAFHSWDAEVKGLDAFPRDEQPNPVIVHSAFEVMVGIGSWLALISVVGAFLRWKKKSVTTTPLYLKALVLSTPLGFVALESGWVVTESGRQPWIVMHVLRTSGAVTTVPGLDVELVFFSFVYVMLAIATAALVKRQMVMGPIETLKEADDHA